MTLPIDQIAAKLQQARVSQKLAIDQFAQKIALSPSQIKALEKGDLRPFYSDAYFKQAATRYADFLSVSIDGEEPTETPVNRPADQTSVNSAPVSIAVEAVTRSEPSPEHHSDPTPPAPRGRRVPLLAVSMTLVGVLFLVVSQIDLLAPKEVSPALSSGPAAAVPPPQTESEIKKASTPINPASNSGLILFSDSTWVQIVLKSGEKQNLRASPSQPIEFSPEHTAAIAFGKPSKAELLIRGRKIEVSPHIQPVDPPRALVIISSVL